ncbi:MAG: ribonuclease III [Alphaproteobacteria bacterium]|nr:ribonuclease III [Alphaproteobacteria bacterium]MBU1525717.1 ribonuclease III [Alphaproteobacteria bacterium]MBU2117604.1 ribonuclease III [Alphaproteobacteria bacterium]MBU2351902.1 ribonuclease III [Alphaproteobacteria bacterium]MBU2382756.1 ribonuclease III [Alphaproteobacteria bacterium]
MTEARNQNRRAEAVRDLTTRLGHPFARPELLETALTHASVGEGASHDARGRPFSHNQRQEFLGDRVLGLLVAERLMRDLPDADEGVMSSRLHALVDKAACARAAERLGVGAAMRLSPGESKQGGRRREGVLGDAMEAVLAAVYLDGGLDAARAVFERAWAEEIAAPAQPGLSNPKSALQEWSLGGGRGLPTYRIAGRTGSDHAPTFTVEVTVPGLQPLTGRGRSRQEAEKAAAVALLSREGVI